MTLATQFALAAKLGYSPDEAAKILGISRTLLYAEWGAGRGPAAIKIGRRTIITDTALRDYLRTLQSEQHPARIGDAA